MVEKTAVAVIVAGALLYIILYYRKLKKEGRCTGCSFSGNCRYEKKRDNRTCSTEDTKLKENE
jgi:hypothetical protein